MPSLAKSDGEVIDGHLRLKGAIAAEMREVPVVPCDGWTEAQMKAFLLMVNRSVNWAESDLDALANLRFNLRDLAPAALNHWLFPELNPSPNILVMTDDSAPASARPGFRWRGCALSGELRSREMIAKWR